MYPQLLIYLIASLALSVTSFAKDGPAFAKNGLEDNPSLKEFKALCREHHGEGALKAFPAPEVGDIVFAPTSNIINNQGRFSWAAVIRKTRKMFGNDSKAYAEKKKGKWHFKYDDGRSAFPKKKAIRGIYDRGRIYIDDGHHRALISAYLGSQTIPVQIIADISQANYSPEQVRAYMERSGHSYFRNYRGSLTNPVDLCDMVDDPNLELARLLMGRIDVDVEDGDISSSESDESRLVLGLKSHMDISFLEFYVADALRRAGVEWDNDNSPDIEKSELKTYLTILRDAAARNPNSPLRKVFLFEKPTRMADLDLRDHRLTAHLRNLSCEDLLTVR